MRARYIVQKVPVVFHVQGTRHGRKTSEEPVAGFHWLVREAVSGDQVGDPHHNQQQAEDACLKLNNPRN